MLYFIMENQEDILNILDNNGPMSTFDFRQELGIYPRSILNKILLVGGYVEKYTNERRIYWKLTEEGKMLLQPTEDKVDTFTLPDLVEDMAEEIQDLETQPEEKKEGWLKRFKNRMKKKKLVQNTSLKTK